MLFNVLVSQLPGNGAEVASISVVVVVADTAVTTVTFVVVVVSRGMEFNLASSTAIFRRLSR